MRAPGALHDSVIFSGPRFGATGPGPGLNSRVLVPGRDRVSDTAPGQPTTNARTSQAALQWIGSRSDWIGAGCGRAARPR